MTAVAALPPDTQPPGIQAHVVEQNQHAFGRDFIKLHRFPYSLAGTVHKCRRFHQKYALSAKGCISAQRFKFQAVDFNAAFAGDALHRAKARVVARVFIVAAGISQPDGNPLYRTRRYGGRF